MAHWLRTPLYQVRIVASQWRWSANIAMAIRQLHALASALRLRSHLRSRRFQTLTARMLRSLALTAYDLPEYEQIDESSVAVRTTLGASLRRVASHPQVTEAARNSRSAVARHPAHLGVRVWN